jgi:hypothetical protein
VGKTSLMVGFALFAVALLSVQSSAEEPARGHIPKKALPDAGALREAKKLVSEIYKNDLAKARRPEEKAKVASRLLQAGTETKDDVAGKYVLFVMAKDLAMDAGAMETAQSAVEEIDKGYEIDGLKLKSEAMARLVKCGRSPEDFRKLVKWAEKVIDEAVSQDRYDLARQVAGGAVSAAKQSRDLDLMKRISTRSEDIREIESASIDARNAMATLATDPNNPDANRLAGRFVCFVKEDWPKGLPMLALGNDAALKTMAEHDLRGAGEAGTKATLGDGWWDLAENESGVGKMPLLRRAAFWYQQAVVELGGLEKAKIEKRLRQIQTAAGATEPANISKLLNDLTQWTAANGTWQRGSRGEFIGSGTASIRFNQKLPRNYKLEFKMIQKQGMRPRLYLPDANLYFGNEGYDKTLWVYGPDARSVDGKPASYSNDKAMAVGVVMSGESFEFYLDGNRIAKGLRNPTAGREVTFSTGDGWSQGTTVLWDFRFTPGAESESDGEK